MKTATPQAQQAPQKDKPKYPAMCIYWKPGLTRRFKAHCKREGTNMSAKLRELAEKAMAQHGQEAA